MCPLRPSSPLTHTPSRRSSDDAYRETNTTPPKHEFVGGYKRGTAVVLEIKPKEFIEEIVLGKRVTDSVYQSVLQSATALGIHCRRAR